MRCKNCMMPKSNLSQISISNSFPKRLQHVHYRLCVHPGSTLLVGAPQNVATSFPPYLYPPKLSPVKGSCTLAIVMLNFFSDGELPGDVKGPFASRDVTSFYEIWQAAQNIEATCLMQYGRPGWAAEGMLPFQATVSLVYRKYRAGMHEGL